MVQTIPEPSAAEQQQQQQANKDQWSSKKYDKHASFVPALGAPVLRLLDPQPHERILDLGAGDGVLTIELEKQCQSVVAIDASADMIHAAQAIGCKDARVVDGHDLGDSTPYSPTQVKYPPLTNCGLVNQDRFFFLTSLSSFFDLFL